MSPKALPVVLATTLSALGPSCGSESESEPLTQRQETAYRQIVSYEEHPGRIALRSHPYQQAAAQQMRKNVRILRAADLGDKADEALSTLAALPISGPTPPDRVKPDRVRKRKQALATLKSAVADRLD